MAYRKKYKALILKQVPCILKYMACIFQLSKYLKNNVLKKGKNQPFSGAVLQRFFFLRCQLFVQESIIV